MSTSRDEFMNHLREMYANYKDNLLELFVNENQHQILLFERIMESELEVEDFRTFNNLYGFGYVVKFETGIELKLLYMFNGTGGLRPEIKIERGN